MWAAPLVAMSINDRTISRTGKFGAVTAGEAVPGAPRRAAPGAPALVRGRELHPPLPRQVTRPQTPLVRHERLRRPGQGSRLPPTYENSRPKSLGTSFLGRTSDIDVRYHPYVLCHNDSLPCRPRRLAAAGRCRNREATAQSHVYVKFLKGTKFKDGTFLMDKAEEYARREFAAHQTRGSDPRQENSGPNYDQWKERSLNMQRKIEAATLSGRIAGMERQNDGPGYER